MSANASPAPLPADPAPAGSPPVAARTRYRSKTLAAWLALALGAAGVHRLYLNGLRDKLAWAHWPFTLAGLAGAVRMSNLGQDDRIASVLVPVLGLMLAQGMLCAIVYALTPDERWDARRNPGRPGRASGWGAVLAAVAALLIGGIVLIGSIAFSIQRFFEWQQAPVAAADAAAPTPPDQKMRVLTTYNTAAMNAVAGIVKIHASRMFAASPQRTADALRTEPTP